MTLKNQILTILLFTLLLSGLRLLTIDDPSFTIIKKQKISPEISLIPEEFTEPMSINLDLAKNLFDDKSAIFIDGGWNVPTHVDMARKNELPFTL